MAKTRKVIRWTDQHIKLLRKSAGRKTVKAIAKELKRTEAAVRFKAHMESISLAMR